jgi:hypothetical protein
MIVGTRNDCGDVLTPQIPPITQTGNEQPERGTSDF